MKPALPVIVTAVFAVLWPGATASAEDLLPLPFHEKDISSVRAYPTRESMNVYMVWESHVFVISADLPLNGTDRLTLDTGTDGCTVTQHYGEGIAMYILPAGPVVPFPPDFHHWSRDAIGGTVVITNVPARDEPEFGEVITITLESIDFGDGETHSLGPVETTTSVYPP